jgi:hypothetical protein
MHSRYESKQNPINIFHAKKSASVTPINHSKE